MGAQVVGLIAEEIEDADTPRVRSEQKKKFNRVKEREHLSVAERGPKKGCRATVK